MNTVVLGITKPVVWKYDDQWHVGYETAKQFPDGTVEVIPASYTTLKTVSYETAHQAVHLLREMHHVVKLSTPRYDLFPTLQI